MPNLSKQQLILLWTFLTATLAIGIKSSTKMKMHSHLHIQQYDTGESINTVVCENIPNNYEQQQQLCESSESEPQQEACACYQPGYCRDAYVNTCTCPNEPSIVNYTTGGFCNVGMNFPNVSRCPVYPIGISPMCGDDRTLGCLCYANATCIQTPVNPCSDCVGSVLLVEALKRCDGTPIDPTGMCEPTERLAECFTYYPIESCVCYNNGSCLTTMSNRCTDCANFDVFSIINGSCPGQIEEDRLSAFLEDKEAAEKEEGAEFSKIFAPDEEPLNITTDMDTLTASICTPDDRNVGSCPRFLVRGGICYKNGTCLEDYVDRCSNCQDDEVFSVLEGTRYPRNISYLCAPSSREAGQVCANSTSTTQGCMCYLDNSCVYQDVNKCVNCAEGDVVAVFENQVCPYFAPGGDGPFY